MRQPDQTGPTTLAVLLLASTLGVMAGATVMPVLEVIRTDLEVSGTEAGLIITTHGLAIAVSSPLIGRLIDRWGVRPPLAAGLVLYGLGGGAGMLTTSYPALIASRVLLGPAADRGGVRRRGRRRGDRHDLGRWRDRLCRQHRLTRYSVLLAARDRAAIDCSVCE